jgi:alpha-galactosidase
MRTPSLLFLLALAAPSLPAVAQAPPSPGAAPHLSLDSWASATPFSFTYDGRPSSGILRSWARTRETQASPGGRQERISYRDPSTGLSVTAEVRVFDRFDAVEWVLRFRNEGAQDTPLLEEIEPLDWTFPADGICVLHHARGSDARRDDYEPIDDALEPGSTVRMRSEKGLPSSGSTLPFFNLQVGDGGLVGAIGWTGNWSADFAYDRPPKALTMRAGMKETHLVLHPGEEIRTPRLLLLGWKGGDWRLAQNTWRRLLLAYYSPLEGGRPAAGPVLFGSWGCEAIQAKLALVRLLHEHRVPYDVYAVDAGWYGRSEGDGDEGPSPWWKNRGDWWPHRTYFPNGLKPLGDALAADGLGFSLWVEPETAEPGTRMITEHPDWYLHVPHAINDGAALLNLGDPAAREGITAFLTNLISEAGVTWYRQDFNIPPERYWAMQDAPSRVGMTEIRHVEGLYSLWDYLRAHHPALRIDNCASGGRRLDLEMISRSCINWRTDFGITDAVVEQMQTQALSPWVPLNVGFETVWTTKPWNLPGPFGTPEQVYDFRSGYSAGFGSPAFPGGAPWFEWLRSAVAEYREVQPYFLGDFYPLLPYTLDTNAWTAWQWHLPEENKGMVMVFRRPGSLFTSMELDLHGLEAGALYQVEVRTGLGRGETRPMNGERLSHFPVALAGAPSSELILYSRAP